MHVTALLPYTVCLLTACSLACIQGHETTLVVVLSIFLAVVLLARQMRVHQFRMLLEQQQRDETQRRQAEAQAAQQQAQQAAAQQQAEQAAQQQAADVD